MNPEHLLAIFERVKRRVHEDLPSLPPDVAWEGYVNLDREVWVFRVSHHPGHTSDVWGCVVQVEAYLAERKAVEDLAERIVATVVQICKDGLPPRAAPGQYVTRFVTL